MSNSAEAGGYTVAVALTGAGGWTANQWLVVAGIALGVLTLIINTLFRLHEKKASDKERRAADAHRKWQRENQ